MKLSDEQQRLVEAFERASENYERCSKANAEAAKTLNRHLAQARALEIPYAKLAYAHLRAMRRSASPQTLKAIIQLLRQRARRAQVRARRRCDDARLTE